jgi:superfamily I DNA and RNA helicase
MKESLFFNQIEESANNKFVLDIFQKYATENSENQIYLINSPLGEKYSYPYEKNAIVVLSPKHKIIFLDISNEPRQFEEYCEDFLDDLSSISDKYNYKKYIGRQREWKNIYIQKETVSTSFDVNQLLENNKLETVHYRVGELLISLLVGSINDIEKVGIAKPDSILDRVKRNIILFDGEQTRFIYKKFSNKTISIQGLSGTGKTELLLHKLKELYLKESESKIFFTCHNIALANTLKSRVPKFFNFMKVEKQIEWFSRLWVDRAWGSQKQKDSGLYSYLSDFYNFPFQGYRYDINYHIIFTKALDHINNIPADEFTFAFDYILIDERQDFPKVFFELCEKIARKKVYIAGDIFQDIFENTKETELEVDIVLNKCYRTDPRTLMFAHSIGLGLFEEVKLNWFEDSYWEAIGYKLQRKENREIELFREPIRRFEDLATEKFESIIIENSTHISRVIEIINQIKESHPTATAEDVAIIILGKGQKVYEYIDKLSYSIQKEIKWKVNRAIETKSKITDALYITNPNNVKGLEFPFIICITNSIAHTYRFRNILYTMLTRSFIQSYLLVQKDIGLKNLNEGLSTINKENLIRTLEPSPAEKEIIKNTIVEIQNKKNISYKEFLTQIFEDLKILPKFRSKLAKAITETDIEEFDKEQTIKFINANKEFYS